MIRQLLLLAFCISLLFPLIFGFTLNSNYSFDYVYPPVIGLDELIIDENNYSHDIFASLSKVEGENLESTINCVKFMPSHYFARDVLKPLKDQDHYFGNIEKLALGIARTK